MDSTPVRLQVLDKRKDHTVFHDGQSEEEITSESSLKQTHHHPYLNPLQFSSRLSSDGDPSPLLDDNTNDEEISRLLPQPRDRLSSTVGSLSRSWKTNIGRSWNSNKGLVMVLTAQLFGALMNVIARLLETSEHSLNAFQLMFVRMGITSMLSSLYMWWTAVKDFPFGPKEVRKLLFARGFGGFFGLFGIYYSLQYLPLAEATVITFLAPIVTCWACSFLLHESFTRTEQIAGLLSLFGVVLIARPTSLFRSHGNLAVAPSKFDNGINATNASYPIGLDVSHTVTPIQRLTAVGVALVGVLGAACAYTTIRWIGKRAHPLVCINYFAAMVTLVATLVLLFVPGMNFKLPHDLKQWALLVSLGICGFLMQLMLTAGLTYEKSSRATNMVYTQMLFALAFDKIVFDVTPGALSVIGSSLILGSALYIAVQGNRARDGVGDEQAQQDEEQRLVGSDADEVEASSSNTTESFAIQRTQPGTLRV